MRIIAGQLGGRKLSARVPDGTRPTADRVREALGSLLAARGAFEDAVVLDLFAGTGALGIEAFSRGAVQVVAVDNAPAALQCLETNLRALGVADRIAHRRIDLLARPARVIEALTGLAREPFSLVFADPPYSELPRVLPMLHELAGSELCRADALFVIEHAKDSELPELDGLPCVGRYRYGDTAITLLARPPQMGEGV